MDRTFRNVYADETRARSYAGLEYPGTYYLAFRDLPGLIERHVRGRTALDFGFGAMELHRVAVRVACACQRALEELHDEFATLTEPSTAPSFSGRFFINTFGKSRTPHHRRLPQEGHGRGSQGGTWSGFQPGSGRYSCCRFQAAPTPST